TETAAADGVAGVIHGGADHRVWGGGRTFSMEFENRIRYFHKEAPAAALGGYGLGVVAGACGTNWIGRSTLGLLWLGSKPDQSIWKSRVAEALSSVGFDASSVTSIAPKALSAGGEMPLPLESRRIDHGTSSRNVCSWSDLFWSAK